jgi:hypothetical protein
MPPSLSADPDDLPGLNGFNPSEAIGDQGQEVFQQDRLSAKNNNRDFSLPEILLIFESAIDGQDNIEFCSLGGGQKLAIFKPSKTGISGRLAIVTGEIVAQSRAHTLIKKKPHSCLGG